MSTNGRVGQPSCRYFRRRGARGARGARGGKGRVMPKFDETKNEHCPLRSVRNTVATCTVCGAVPPTHRLRAYTPYSPPQLTSRLVFIVPGTNTIAGCGTEPLMPRVLLAVSSLSSPNTCRLRRSQSGLPSIATDPLGMSTTRQSSARHRSIFLPFCGKKVHKENSLSWQLPNKTRCSVRFCSVLFCRKRKGLFGRQKKYSKGLPKA